jgi:tetratricopeptide (TPR) repeat protein
MKVLVKCFIIMAILLSLHTVQCKTIDEYIKEAEDYNNAGKLEEAIGTMEEAVKEYPNNSMAYTYLGQFIGMQAQRMSDFSKITEVIDRAFLMWDKAISLDSHNLMARHLRGAWGVSTPEFMGKLEKGIGDLKFLIGVYEQSTDPDAKEQLVSTYNLLGVGYQKQGGVEKAKETWNTIIEIAPETEYAKTAKENIDKIILAEEQQSEFDKSKKPDTPKIMELKERVLKDPNNSELLIELGKAYLDNENYGEAEKVLKEAISIEPSNVDAYKLLLLAFEGIGMGGYDIRIYMDTDFMTNLVFETMRFLDKAITLSPEDIELRLTRGTLGVNFPFFAGKLEQGIEDLNMVINSNAQDSIKAQAKFYLGFAYRKKARTQWIDVVKNYKDSRASKMVFDELNPNVKRIDISKVETPVVVIDFILGFADELAPQTAVWIEDKDGKFIKTIYVSGFSGYAKEKQVNLPRWAKSSNFSDTDGVTGASVDLGHHIYVWDLKDSIGKEVKSGEYVIKVEVSYWPSMQYQWVSANIDIGKKETKTIVEEGNLIPYLEVKYIP